MPLPEHLQDRYEEISSARAEARGIVRIMPVQRTVEQPTWCEKETCHYPLCDCWMQQDGSDD